MKILVAIIFSMILSSQSLMAASEEEGITTGQYVTGGVVGSVIGLGIGHAIQKRYMPLGLVFTIGQAAGYTAIIADSWTTYQDSSLGYSRRLNLGTVGTIGLVVCVGLHVWEVIDLWVNGLDYRREKKTSELQEPSRSTFAILPGSGNSEAPGLSVLMQF